MVNISGTISLGAEPAFKTIFEIQFMGRELNGLD